MRKIIAFLVLMFSSATFVIAQSMQEVVYLKNGSVVRGSIIEQVPGQSIKVQTSDGNIFVYQENEVEKIAKEQVADKKTLRQQMIDESKREAKKAVLSKGYKAFVGLDYSYNFNDFSDMLNVAISTVHGYQINPYFFVGAGISLNIWGRVNSGKAQFGMPIFANIKITPLKNYITPVVDVRLGSSVGDIKGLYFNPQAGIHIGVRNRSAVNIMVGYQLQKMDGYDVKYNAAGDMLMKKKKVNCEGLALRVQWEF